MDTTPVYYNAYCIAGNIAEGINLAVFREFTDFYDCKYLLMLCIVTSMIMK